MKEILGSGKAESIGQQALKKLIEKLKKSGVWVYAAEAGGSPYYDTDLDRPAAIVFGSEGRGVSDLAKKRCDGVISIPLYGNINSLNVSAAAAVLLTHAAVSQREGGADNAKKIK